jgi:uncharacterized protein
MPATLRHFAINADDVDRARRFYQAVLGWNFDPWGPPDFYQIHNAGDGVIGALQGRRNIGERQMPGIEMTVGVDDLAQTIQAVEANGGRLLNQPFRIDGVGELVFFEDSEGNALAAMQYEAGRFG